MSRGASTVMGRAGAIAIAGPVLLLMLTVAPAAASSPHLPAMPLDAVPTIGPAASFDTGRISITFPASLPQVELSQDGNSSVNAVLQIAGILEIAPGSAPRPSVVAAAFPTLASGFNATSTPGPGGSTLVLSAALVVHRVGGTLWSPGGLSVYPSALLAPASLQIAYSVVAGGTTSSGVAVTWGVENWPWLSTSDLLAVELHFSVPDGQAMVGCSSSAPLSGGAACPGTFLSTDGIVWDPVITAVEGEGAQGPLARVGWSGAASLPTGAPARYQVGTYSTGNASVDVVLGVPAAGTDHLVGGVSFALSTPSPPSPPVVLHADVGAYLATALVAGGGGAATLLAYRRRVRAVAAEL